MENICRRCFTPLKDGQRVCVVITAVYHSLLSWIYYALDPTTVEADSETLIHADPEDCKYDEEDEPEPA